MRKIFLSFLLMCITVFFAMPSTAMILPLPMVTQQQTNWCWAGSTKAIENYYGIAANECDMASYLEERNYWGSEDCCQYAPLSLLNSNNAGYAECNQGNYFAASPGSVSEIMSYQYGTPNNVVNTYLSQSAVQTEIYAGRPFEMAWAWSSGGGHALVGYGITGSQVNYMDPWPWNPQANVASYSWVVQPSDSSHTWYQTIRPTITPQPPVPDIEANGSGGTVYVNHAVPANITASLNPGGFTNTQADWWVAAYLNGILYYGYYDDTSASWQWTTQVKPAAQEGLVSLSPVSVFSSLR